MFPLACTNFPAFQSYIQSLFFPPINYIGYIFTISQTFLEINGMHETETPINMKCVLYICGIVEVLNPCHTAQFLMLIKSN